MQAVKTQIPKNARTSQTHPLQIAEVTAGEGFGKIGITFCPGKQDRFAATGAWHRDLALDLDVIQHWGATLIITLLESIEIKELKVPELGQAIQTRGIDWRHLPIADYSVPSTEFEHQWIEQGHEIRTRLLNGQNILLHCKGGLGRAGMMAARLLAELGMDPVTAIRAVRRVRKGAIETPSQFHVVRKTTAIHIKK